MSNQGSYHVAYFSLDIPRDFIGHKCMGIAGSTFVIRKLWNISCLNDRMKFIRIFKNLIQDTSLLSQRLVKTNYHAIQETVSNREFKWYAPNAGHEAYSDFSDDYTLKFQISKKAYNETVQTTSTFLDPNQISRVDLLLSYEVFNYNLMMLLDKLMLMLSDCYEIIQDFYSRRTQKTPQHLPDA